MVYIGLCFIILQFCSSLNGKAIDSSIMLESVSYNGTKVTQSGGTSGLAYSTSVASANMAAVGYPSGIINNGGTSASFNGTSTVSQDLPSNTSTSIGGSLTSNCEGGMIGTYIAGQQGIGLNASGNCNSIVIPINNANAHTKEQNKE